MDNTIAVDKSERTTNNSFPPVSTSTMYSVTPNNDVPATTDIVEMDVNLDGARRQKRYIALSGKIHPAQVYLHHGGHLDEPGLYGTSPWFDKTAVLDGTIIHVSGPFLLIKSRVVES